MANIALGVKVFSRTEKLKSLIDSVPEVISTVYIIDDGEGNDVPGLIDEKQYGFDVEIFEVEYDAGLGYGRKKMVEESDEPYLLVVDSDNTVPENILDLKDQLEADSELGAVGGLYLEHGQIAGACHDIFIEGTTLWRDVREEKDTTMIAGEPFIEFDFIPNVALFRRECVEEYCWDEEYTIGYEHIDFYVGHKLQTEWKFGVNPSVLFGHYPGGSSGYQLERSNKDKIDRSERYFKDKWGIENEVWNDGFPRSLTQKELALNYYFLSRLGKRGQITANSLLKTVKKYF